MDDEFEQTYSVRLGWSVIARVRVRPRPATICKHVHDSCERLPTAPRRGNSGGSRRRTTSTPNTMIGSLVRAPGVRRAPLTIATSIDRNETDRELERRVRPRPLGYGSRALRAAAQSAAAGLRLMPDVGYWRTPGVMVALTSVVHDRQAAAGEKHGCTEDHQ